LLEKEKYKLFLINPKQKIINYAAQSELCKILGKKRFMIPLALPVLASLTPENYDVRIIDEDIEKIPENELPDLVGITTLASTILRVFEIADWYRSKGIKVILGGPYASFEVDEVLQHADSVVVGEAEDVWSQCLSDFEKGELKTVYKSENKTDYKNPKPARWDLINMKDVFQVSVQVSRGCPYKCEFCLVSKVFGNKMRYRDIDNVISEIENLPTKKILFIDDNLTANKKYARELMQRLKPLGISWGCMSSIEIAKDENLLNDMAEAGCFNILIGFESLNPESLDETNKDHNRAAKDYADSVDRIHKAGIHITASFVVGFDNDTLVEFDKIFDFTMQTGLSYVNLNILGAPPGSDLYNRLKEEGRWYNASPDHRSGLFPCFHYNKMSQTDIFNKYIETIDRLFSYKTIYEKLPVLFGNGSFVKPYNDDSSGFFFKFRTTMLILKEFFFSPNKYKRKIFSTIVSYIRKDKLSIDKGFSYMLSMLSYHRHVEIIKSYLDEYREIVKKVDKGSWEKMKIEE
jgi:radical SAM superfamily enzyme YgiQ (UPF0313 family)